MPHDVVLILHEGDLSSDNDMALAFFCANLTFFLHGFIITLLVCLNHVEGFVHKSIAADLTFALGVVDAQYITVCFQNLETPCLYLTS